MRICSPQLGVSPSATLGGEVYDRETLKQMAQLGAKIEILLPAGLPHPNVPGWRVTRLPLKRGYRWFVSNFIFVPYIGRAYRLRPFDVLRVHSPRFTGLAALWARRIFRLSVPIVAHHHHVDRDALTNLVDGRVLKAFDLTITVSNFSKLQLVDELGCPPELIHVVYNGVDQSLFSQSRRPRSGEAEGVPTVVHVGSLIPRKNVGLIIEAFGTIQSNLPQAELILIGQGPEQERLKTLAVKYGLSQSVKFAGIVTEEEKLATYLSADVLVTASSVEGFGLAVAEGMACGLPVVAARTGALPELICDGETGLLVPVGDAVALGKSTLQLLNDKGLAWKLGQAGRARAQRMFQWSRTAAETLALYEELL